MSTSGTTGHERTGHEAASPRELVTSLVRVRQIREFTSEPPSDDALEAITDVGRWSGSSTNSQPWRFIVIRDREVLRRLHEAGMPQTRSLATAPAAIAIVLPDDQFALTHAFDEGRAAERMLDAAYLVGLAAGIAWIKSGIRPLVAELLHLPEGRFVRTLIVVGHPTEAGLTPKGQGRLPRDEVVFAERWPEGLEAGSADGVAGVER